MQRSIYTEAHQLFRKTVYEFFANEVVPEYGQWEEAGQPPRRFWKRAGELGLLTTGFPARFGGTPGRDFTYNAILTEGAQEFGLALGGLRVQTDICLPYLVEYADEAQQDWWLPRMATGDAIVALAISEPAAGSDIKALRTTAVRDGDHFVVNGSKTFISNGAAADLVILAVTTDPAAGRNGLSLLLVDSTTPGFSRGRRLQKIGLKAQDLAELFFDDMRVPADQLLGEEGQGFRYLTNNLAQERLSIALNSQASAAVAVRHTTEAFAGMRNNQAVKFGLATAATSVAAGQALIDQSILSLVRGELSAADAAMVKLYATESQARVVDICLELLGIDGYVSGSPVGRAYADGRVARIYGGSSEIMRVIVAKSLGV